MRNERITFFLVLFSFFNFYCVFGQQEEAVKDQHLIETQIKFINKKISSSNNKKKLFWLDSLCKVVRFKKEYNYEPIARRTINFAIAHDSLDIAAYHTGMLANYYNDIIGDPKKGKAVFDSLFPKLNNCSDNNKAKLYLSMGNSYLFLANTQKALKYYKQAYAYADKAGNEKLKANSLWYQSDVLTEAGDFITASKYLITASELYNKVKDTFNIVAAKSVLTILYSKNGFFKEAEKIRNEAIALAEATHSYGQLAILYNNRADEEKENYSSELYFLKKALINCRKSKYEAALEPGILSSIISTYTLSNQTALAEKLFDTLLLKYPTIKSSEKRKEYLIATRHLNFAKGNYAKSIALSKEQLEIEHQFNNVYSIQDIEHFLSQVYEKMGDYRQSSHHLKIYNQIKDSIFSVQKTNTLVYYQTLYETEKKDRKIEMQQSSISLLNSKNNLKNLWTFIGILLLLGLFAFLWTLRSRNFAKRNEIQQEQFSQELIKTQENERIRLARDLHDGVGQKLMLLTRKTKETSNEDVNKLADNTLEELRSISRGLYPATLEKLGITSALQTLINEVDSNSPILFDCEIDDIDAFLDKETALQFYRIVQEVLNNLIKHSQANEASISVEKKSKSIIVTISDNGIGFNPKEAFSNITSLGMKTIQERVKMIKGTISIKSGLDNGTKVCLTLPTL
ncbi:MAG: sensor histidine kinase [Flavobacterium sp.]